MFLQFFQHQIYVTTAVVILYPSLNGFVPFFKDISYTCQSLASFWLNDFWYLSSNVEDKRQENN